MFSLFMQTCRQHALPAHQCHQLGIKPHQPPCHHLTMKLHHMKLGHTQKCLQTYSKRVTGTSATAHEVQATLQKG